MKYTVVLGVDWERLEQLRAVWPTWVLHKPSMIDHPFVIFYDRFGVNANMVKENLPYPHPKDLTLHAWPPKRAARYGPAGADVVDKWSNPQRAKMLSGFVYVPRSTVLTPYWLKLDLDAVATGMDNWIDEQWFENEPAIISHPWGYTKPPGQMLELDAWAAKHGIPGEPLNLAPKTPESTMVSHHRIISWCGFFHTDFTINCADQAERTCGCGHLPVPSQDGYLWYMAARQRLQVIRTQMKTRGWEHHNGTRNVRIAAERSLGII